MSRTTVEILRLARTRAATCSTQVAADPARFESVYRACQADLYRYVLSIVREPHAAEDVLQSAMTRAMEALVHEQRDFELRPWLFRIAHNEAISRFRRERHTVELDDAALAATAVAAPTSSVAETVERNEEIDQLWRDLAGLPERQRQALVLRELSGMGHEEIADVIGSSARSVKQTIFEARRNLLDCAEGRAMDCVDVQRTLSDGDGRVRRGRKMRAHVAGCASCQAFDTALATRPDGLRALAPALPLAMSSALLAHLFPASKGAALTAAASSGSGLAAGTVGGVGSLLAGKVAVVAGVGALAVGGAGVAAVSHSPSAPAASEQRAPGKAGDAGSPSGLTGTGAATGVPAGGDRSAQPTTGPAAPASTTPARSTTAATTPGRASERGATPGNAAGTPGSAVSAAAKARAEARADARAEARAQRRSGSKAGSANAKAGGNAKAKTNGSKGSGGGKSASSPGTSEAPESDASSGSKKDGSKASGTPDSGTNAPAKTPEKESPAASGSGSGADSGAAETSDASGPRAPDSSSGARDRGAEQSPK